MEIGSEAASLLETHFHMRLSREWDRRFEKLFRQGGVAKWYSGVGSEATTVASAACLRRDDALLTIHRDSGAILRYYASCEDLVPGLLPVENRHGGEKARELLYRLACQLLGRSDGFTAGYDRSFHYAHLDEETGLKHIGMISHMGAMIPVAAGVALAFRQQGSDRVALNYIGDGGTSTGEFHEGLNMAAVLDAPLVLVILNNRYAFSTPTGEQYRAESLAARAEGYGIEGIRIDGNDPLAVSAAVSEAVARARSGGARPSSRRCWAGCGATPRAMIPCGFSMRLRRRSTRARTRWPVSKRAWSSRESPRRNTSRKYTVSAPSWSSRSLTRLRLRRRRNWPAESGPFSPRRPVRPARGRWPGAWLAPRKRPATSRPSPSPWAMPWRRIRRSS